MNLFKRSVASLTIVAITAMGLPMTAQSAIVSTDEALSVQVGASNRDRVNSFLNRADVRQALERQGVAGDAVVARVQAMTDTEVAQLADRVDQAPAGGEILGLMFTVFLVLLVTDIMGLTKVFPFTRSVR